MKLVYNFYIFLIVFIVKIKSDKFDDFIQGVEIKNTLLSQKQCNEMILKSEYFHQYLNYFH